MTEQRGWRRGRDASAAGARARPTGVATELGWDAAIRLFLQGWAADHPGIGPTTQEHYREQLANRVAAFAKERGIVSVQHFSRHDLRAFVVWLEGLVTYNGRPLAPRGKQMALATAKRFLGWLYQERLLPEDIGARIGSYRLDMDPEPRATPQADLEKVLADLHPDTPTGLRNTAMIHLLAFCGLRVSELVGLNAADLSLEEGRVRIRAETSKVRRTRFVDLPLTIVDGQETVKPEIADLLTSYPRQESIPCSRACSRPSRLLHSERACPHWPNRDAPDGSVAAIPLASASAPAARRHFSARSRGAPAARLRLPHVDHLLVAGDGGPLLFVLCLPQVATQ